MLIDTHSHIYSEEFRGETDEIIKRALGNGVEKILLPNIDSSSIKMMIDLVDQYPSVCFPMMGIHPTSVKDDFEQELEVFEFWLSKRKFVAIGEIGIDLYWDKTFREEQEYVFCRQLKMAKELNLPVAIHVRDSFDVVLENIKKEYHHGMKGVFHCFSGSTEQAKEVISLGFKIGIGGTITYKNSGVADVISTLKPTDILLETDAPYLSPAPFRGKRNESSYIVNVLQKVAEVFSLPEEDIARITTESAQKLFNLY